MSGGDDWQVGDLALCIDDTDYDGTALPLRLGAPYTVTDVFIGFDGMKDVTALELAEVPADEDGDGFDARCFHRIPPLTDEERSSFLRELDEPVKQPAA